MRCRCGLCFFLSSSAGSIGTTLASQELRPEQRLLVLLAGEPFPFFFIRFWKKRLLFPKLCFCGPFAIGTSMSSLSIYRKTQHSEARSALHKAANKVRADQSATTQASRQSWRELACRRAFIIQLAAFSKRRKISKYVRQKNATTHKVAEAGVMREGLAFIYNVNKIKHCSFSPSFVCISYMHAASALFSWSMELFLDFGKSSVCT